MSLTIKIRPTHKRILITRTAPFAQMKRLIDDIRTMSHVEHVGLMVQACCQTDYDGLGIEAMYPIKSGRIFIHSLSSYILRDIVDGHYDLCVIPYHHGPWRTCDNIVRAVRCFHIPRVSLVTAQGHTRCIRRAMIPGYLLFNQLKPTVLRRTLQKEVKNIEQSVFEHKARYVSHPFRQYQCNNRYGVSNKDAQRIRLENPKQAYRICCFGGSTTESGWPDHVWDLLNQEHRDGYDVINFGTSGYTTAHTLVTLMLTAVEFQPKMIIIHQGINDVKPLKFFNENVREDYSHLYHAYRFPVSKDRLLLKRSGLYRYWKSLRYLFTGQSYMYQVMLNQCIQHPMALHDFDLGCLGDPEKRLQYYRRNITTMIQKSRADQIDVVLVTQPFSSRYFNLVDGVKQKNPKIDYVDACNTILADLAGTHQVHLVDLCPHMKNRDEYFIDPVHTTSTGEALKARLIANAILNIAHERSPVCIP